MKRRLSRVQLILLFSLFFEASQTGCQRITAIRRGASQSNDSENLVALREKVHANPTSMRVLSNREYISSVSDLMGVQLSLDLLKEWSPNSRFSGFDSIQWSNFDAKSLRDRVNTLEIILDKAIASPKVMTCPPDPGTNVYPDCARGILEGLAERAFRRYLKPGEVVALKEAYLKGVELAKSVSNAPADLMQQGIRAGLATLFLAPQFITKVEPAPATTGTSATERDLDSFELASRLSFLLMGSVPDDELWALAKNGSILKTEVLIQQADRMLKARPDRFVENFMGQWLEFRNLDTAALDTIENSLWMETKLTLTEILKRDLPVTRILDPGFTFLNQTLANHYGIAGKFPSGPGEFALALTQERGGILTQGSILTLTSTPSKTSAIRRGRWVQGRLLCKTIPPPSPELFEQIKSVTESIPANATVKVRLNSHRNSSSICFGCHKYMDPIGLGLEGFDQYGAKRLFYDTAHQVPVETDSELLGQPFKTFVEMNHLLVNMPEVNRCVAEKVAIYSLGQVIDSTSPDTLDLINYLSFKEKGQVPSFRDLILRMIQSKAFRSVRHEGEKI